MIEGVEARLGSLSFCDVEMYRDIADGNSVLAFRYGERTAVFRIRQTLRSDAISVIHKLKDRGFDIHIFSGDRDEAVAEVACALGIADWRGGMKPAEKIAALETLRGSGKKVLMVGDGLNDAPALAAASVSISPITATELTQAQADAVFLGEKLQPVLDSIEIARRARSLMRQNLWLAVIYNGLAVPIAIAGLVTPLIAALAMSGSSILVTLNALRAGSVGHESEEVRARRNMRAMMPVRTCH
jgi:Cu2+-exporting ATPase